MSVHVISDDKEVPINKVYKLEFFLHTHTPVNEAKKNHPHIVIFFKYIFIIPDVKLFHFTEGTFFTT